MIGLRGFDFVPCIASPSRVHFFPVNPKKTETLRPCVSVREPKIKNRSTLRRFGPVIENPP
jgi:hypothetical protein